MVDLPPTTVPSAPASPPGPVDGLSAPGPSDPHAVRVLQMKKQILLLGAALYAFYVFWCVFLLLTLPDPEGKRSSLVMVGILSNLTAIVAFLGAGYFLLKRISVAATSIAMRRRSLIKLIAFLAPGILLSLLTPIMIMREPRLPLEITQPASAADLIAPVAVTFSAERAADILRNLGYRPVKYQWDTDGDGKMNEETVAATTTAVYERSGVVTAVGRIILDGGGIRRITRRVSIPQAVFSMAPVQPVVRKPVKFSVASLLTDPKMLKQVQWNFGDDTPVETVTSPDILHTYYAIGAYPIAATVQLTNQAQVLYKRTVTVQEQPPLPFPATLVTEPRTLVGPAPFGILLRLETKEPLIDVQWSFGDGKEDRGPDLLRTSHAFEKPGIYPITVRARNAEGKLAELTVIVRVTETLVLTSLQFEGKPPVVAGKVSGEVPLELDLTPKTTTPLVRFDWDLPDDPSMHVRDGKLTGILRSEGTRTVTLLAQGAEGRSMRMPISIEVKPPTAEPAIQMIPDGGTAPLTVTFDASRTFIPPGETVAGFSWLFGDETQGDRDPELGAARVEHIYKSPGEYTVQLAAVLVSGKKFTAKRTLIVRRPELSACITASRLEVAAGKGIEFDASCSAGSISTLVWDVRRDDDPDAVLAQSSDETYVYVFSEPGEYTVSLTLEDGFGSQDRKSVSIRVTPGAESAPPDQPAP